MTEEQKKNWKESMSGSSVYTIPLVETEELQTRFQTVQKRVAQRLALRQATIKQLRDARSSMLNLEKQLEAIAKAQLFLQDVALLTQQEVEMRVSTIATVALSTVFGDPYEVKLRFEPKRGKSEASLLFLRDGEEFNPLDDTGGGAVDIAAFALRVSILLLLPKLRKTLILDEPFRFVSKDLLPNVCAVMRKISTETKVQFVLVTHIPELIEAADKTFVVSKRSGRPSVVTPSV